MCFWFTPQSLCLKDNILWHFISFLGLRCKWSENSASEFFNAVKLIAAAFIEASHVVSVLFTLTPTLVIERNGNIFIVTAVITIWVILWTAAFCLFDNRPQHETLGNIPQNSIVIPRSLVLKSIAKVRLNFNISKLVYSTLTLVPSSTWKLPAGVLFIDSWNKRNEIKIRKSYQCHYIVLARSVVEIH